jgi:hypothetical protein
MGLPFGKLGPAYLGAGRGVDPGPLPDYRWTYDTATQGGGFITGVADPIGGKDLAPNVGNAATPDTFADGKPCWFTNGAGYLESAAIGIASFSQLSVVMSLQLSAIAGNNMFGWGNGKGITVTAGNVAIHDSADRLVTGAPIVAVDTPVVVGISFDLSLGKYRIAQNTTVVATTDAGTVYAPLANDKFDSGFIGGLGASSGKYNYIAAWTRMLTDVELLAACNFAVATWK